MDCEPEQQFTASLDVFSAGIHVVFGVVDDGESFLFCLVHPFVAWYVVVGSLVIGDFDDGVNDKEGIAEEGLRVVGLLVPGDVG